MGGAEGLDAVFLARGGAAHVVFVDVPPVLQLLGKLSFRGGFGLDWVGLLLRPGLDLGCEKSTNVQ